MPPKEERAQFQVITTKERVARLDALRVVMRVSRARVVERAMDAGLPALELEHWPRLQRLYALGNMAPPYTESDAGAPDCVAAMLKLGLTGQGWRALVAAYAERNGRKTYGETLEELERAAGIEVASV
jgi:hypothetical protein